MEMASLGGMKLIAQPRITTPRVNLRITMETSPAMLSMTTMITTAGQMSTKSLQQSARDYFERPDDLDQDGTCDSLDNDIDGDEVNNAEDAFPRDPTLWSLEESNPTTKETRAAMEASDLQIKMAKQAVAGLSAGLTRRSNLVANVFLMEAKARRWRPDHHGVFGLLLTFVPTVVHIGLTSRLIKIYDKNDKASRRL